MKNAGLNQAIDLLTREHDQHGLIRCYTGLMLDHYAAISAEFYEAMHEGKDKASDDSSSWSLHNPLSRNQTFREVDSDMLKAFKTEHVVICAGDQADHRLIIPVIVKHRVYGLIDIQYKQKRKLQQEEMLFLTRIFSNLFVLVYKKERDGLTGLLNRLDFQQRFQNIQHSGIENDRRSQAVTSNLCLSLIDIDHFKDVNDKLGHLFGDEVLVHLSQLMNKSFRSYDLLCRYGGEEFAIMLWGTTLQSAITILERFRERVQDYQIPQVGHITLSMGVVEVKHDELLTNVFDMADKALYYAKQHGRNQIQSYEYLLANGQLHPGVPDTGDVELF